MYAVNFSFVDRGRETQPSPHDTLLIGFSFESFLFQKEEPCGRKLPEMDSANSGATGVGAYNMITAVNLYYIQQYYYTYLMIHTEYSSSNTAVLSPRIV